MNLSKPIRVAMPAGGAAVLTSNDQLSRGGNAPLPVVSDSCSGFRDCMHFGDIVVLGLGFTKSGSRKDPRASQDHSRECESTERLVCMSPCNFQRY